MPASSDPVRHSYDRLAAHYDARWAFYIDASVRLLNRGCQPGGDQRVLDVACGTGELAKRWLAQAPRLRVVGVDTSQAMLRRAAAKDALARAAFVQAEATRLPLAAGSVDLLACCNAFHFFRQPQAALAEMRRVVAPGGRLVLVDWCDDFLSCKVCSLWLRWTDPAFYRTYSLRACREALARAGFEVTEAHRERVGWMWGMMRLVCRPG